MALRGASQRLCHRPPARNSLIPRGCAEWSAVMHNNCAATPAARPGALLSFWAARRRLFGRGRGEKFGRRRNELVHLRRGVVLAHVIEPQTMDARILILV